MSGLDKIIDHITQEAREEAQALLDSAREKAQGILAEGKAQADAKVQAIAKQAELDRAAAVKRIQSASELQEKRILLQAKQEQIETVFEKAIAELENLEDAAYFQTLGKMVERYASGEAGTVLLTQKDLGRITEDFRQTCAAHNLTIGTEPVAVRGGFILSYGDIEENCSFDVLVNTSREELQDKVGQLLFG